MAGEHPSPEHGPTPVAVFRLLVARTVLEVRTRSYVLVAERRDRRWRPSLSLPGGDGPPLMTWSAISEEGIHRPFRRMYLVFADEHAFEIRFDAEGGGRCHFRGEARAGALCVAVCGDSPTSAVTRTLSAILRSGARVRAEDGVAWSDCSVRTTVALGSHSLSAERIDLTTGTDAVAAAGDASLSSGYAYGEMTLNLAPPH